MNATTEIMPDAPEGQAGAGFPDPFVYLEPGMAALKGKQIGLVPGAQAPLMEVALPEALRGHAREQVAERQIQGALAAGRDGVEVRPFHTPETERDWSRVLVADRGAIEAWRRMAGKTCKAVLPDYLALPAGEGMWTLASSGSTVLARLGPEDGFSASLSVAEWMLKDALSTPGAAPKAIYSPEPLPPELDTLFAGHDIPVARDAGALKALKLEPPKRLAFGELNFDLRRDPRAARAQLRAAVLPWRWPVLVGLLAAGLWAGAQMLATQGLQAQTAQYRAATLEVVRSEFVTTGPVLDVRTQVSRALAEARVASAGAGQAVAPLDLLGLAADVMTQAGAAPDIIDYSADEGLTAIVRVADFAAADSLAAALREAGLSITVVESRVNDSNEGVRTELRIAGPKAEGKE